jgi:tetratricopeptide (TPR) repeat protein
MQSELAGLRQNLSDNSRYYAAIALAKVGNQQQAFSIIDSTDSPSAVTLRAIAQVYSQLNDPRAVKSGLAQLQTIAEKIDDLSLKANALSAIAQAYSKLSQPEAVKSVLMQAQTIAEKVDDPSLKANALSAIAKAYAELGGWQQVNLIADRCTSNDCEAGVLSTGLTVWAEHQHPELKEEEEEGSSF